MLRLRRQSGGFGNRKVEDEGANGRVLIRGVEARRVIYELHTKNLSQNAHVQFSRVT